MCFRRSAVVAAFVFATATGVSAQLTFDHSPNKDPYRNLFGGRVPEQKTAGVRVERREAPPKPVIVCGTLIVPADPTIDPKMHVAPPSGAEHKMRTVKPPMCQPE